MNVLNKIKSKTHQQKQGLSEREQKQDRKETKEQIRMKEKERSIDLHDINQKDRKKGHNILSKLKEKSKREIQQIKPSTENDVFAAQDKKKFINGRSIQMEKQSYSKQIRSNNKNGNHHKYFGQKLEHDQTDTKLDISSKDDREDFRLSELSETSSYLTSFQKISKDKNLMHWVNPILKVEDQRSRKSREKRLTDKSLLSRNNSEKEEQELNYVYRFDVKKAFQINRMAIFQGLIQENKINTEDKLRIRMKDTKKTTISCKLQQISNPQSISIIFLAKWVNVGLNQYLFRSVDVVKVVQKSRTIKKG